MVFETVSIAFIPNSFGQANVELGNNLRIEGWFLRFRPIKDEIAKPIRRHPPNNKRK